MCSVDYIERIFYALFVCQHKRADANDVSHTDKLIAKGWHIIVGGVFTIEAEGSVALLVKLYECKCGVALSILMNIGGIHTEVTGIVNKKLAYQVITHTADELNLCAELF